MVEIEFPYQVFPELPSATYPSGRVTKRPWVNAAIIANNGRSVRMRVVLDTGADACLFPTAIANVLGLDYVTFPSDVTRGVGSINTTYYTNVRVDLGRGVVADVYAGFTDGMNLSGLGLLGQLGFFEKFDAHFSFRNGKCKIALP